MTLEEKLKNLPENPGCYIMLDVNGEILYVGKAKNLKNRVRQYFFMSGNKTEKVAKMVEKIVDFRFLVTESETDALSLENNLIKKHKPPYNILLKDDKQYPYLKVDVKSDFPRITVTRKPIKDGSKYFGPIMGGTIRDMFKIMEVFRTANCKYDFDKLPKGFRACLNADIDVCCAPCIGKASKEEYRELINKAMDFLNGDYGEIRQMIFDKMMAASEKESFEQALEYKRQLGVIEKMKEKRLVNTGDDFDADIFAISCNGKNSAVSQLTVRRGRLLGGDNYPVSDAGLDMPQNLSSFLNAFGSVTNLDTKNIFVNVDLPDKEALEERLSEKAGRKITITKPVRGIKRKLSDMAEENARVFLDKSQTKIDREFNVTVGAMQHLRDAFSLPSLPRRVECYDISNISGVDKVASMTVFTDGAADRKSYRRFRIKTVEGADDFRSMREVLYRRLLRVKNEDWEFGAKPDLIVIDGGKGQLSFAVDAMQAAGVSIPIVSLAKKEELVFVPGKEDPIFLPRESFGLNLLINIRDEAHRFAITYFRGLHGKNLLKSELDAIPGIGNKRQKILIKRFGSLDGIMNATLEELVSTEGIPRSVAEELFARFRAEE